MSAQPKLCECGCGDRAPLARRTQRKVGHIKGQPIRFINGHAARLRMLPQRWEVVDRGFTSPCHEFLGMRDKLGYGRTDKHRNGERLAHRDAWVEANGPIPDGMHLHHECENPPCINPEHMRAVTHREHRGLHRPTHCKRGHEFTPENVIPLPGGGRKCRPCHYAAVKRWYIRSGRRPA